MWCTTPSALGPGIQAFQDDQLTGMIAVTTHARSGLRRLVFGADAAAMVQWSRIPALVVPVPAA